MRVRGPARRRGLLRRRRMLRARVILHRHGAAGDRAGGQDAGGGLDRAGADAHAGARHEIGAAAVGGRRAQDAGENRVGGDRAGGGAQAHPCAVQVLAGPARRHTKGDSDLVMRTTLELPQQQRVALRGRERLNRGERLAQPLAQLHDVRRLGDAGAILVQHLLVVLRRPQDVERGVVCDAIEPGLQHQLSIRCLHGSVGVDERLLHRVFRTPRAEQPSAVALQCRSITVDDCRKCRIVALASEGHEPVVVLKAQQRRASQAGRVLEQAGLHPRKRMTPA